MQFLMKYQNQFLIFKALSRGILKILTICINKGIKLKINFLISQPKTKNV